MSETELEYLYEKKLRPKTKPLVADALQKKASGFSTAGRQALSSLFGGSELKEMESFMRGYRRDRMEQSLKRKRSRRKD